MTQYKSGIYSTDVSVPCLLSLKVEIVQIPIEDNIFKRSSLTYVLLQWPNVIGLKDSYKCRKNNWEMYNEREEIQGYQD